LLEIVELAQDDARCLDALGMILRCHVDDKRHLGEAVAGFMHTARRQGLNMDRLLLACEARQTVGACLALESPGSSALVMCAPQRASSGISINEQLLRTMRESCRGSEIQLLQSLIRPEEHLQARALAAAGFRFLAELDYMECSVRRRTSGSCRPGLKLHTYNEETHDLFLRCLEESYSETRDCPGLAGVRSPDQVLSGHRATGLYDPQLWYAWTIDGAPAGILLLSRVSNRSAIEVVYVGVSKPFRGRGFGDMMMSLTFQRAELNDAKAITLAVDNTNQPALRLYRRWGFRRVGSRRAWIAVNET
jgi:ribosomal protein S18 acetylase RimI-like enzyme